KAPEQISFLLRKVSEPRVRIMSRETAHAEMKRILGQVPGFFEGLPDDTIDDEWELFKRFELGETAIPAKYRELIGLGIASVLHCWYCSNFHSAMAQFHGASAAEVQEVVHIAKFTAGWSTYLSGSLYDRDRFIKELQEIGEHLSQV
ncbi:MAG: carboxymuconolactone decarboxylase family protein, partial [Candidatus Bipolaricaulia bacterium]